MKKLKRKSDCFNPIDFFDKNDRRAIDDCNDLAKALVVRTGKEQEMHWNNVSEACIAAMAATVVFHGDKEANTRSIQTVREFITNPTKFEMAVKVMTESDAWDGQLAQMGGQMMQLQDKEKHSAISSTLQHLRFLGTPVIADNTRTSTFDPAILRDPKVKVTIYMVLPADRLLATSGLMRCWVSSFIRACVRGGIGGPRVNFVLDEAASAIGHMECVESALALARGFGIAFLFIFQSIGQVKKCFPDQEQVLLGNTTKVFFGTNDKDTADLISGTLGKKTVIVDSGGTTSGTSNTRSFGRDRGVSMGSSGGKSSNWGLQSHELMTPDEIMALSPRTAITIVPGMRPILSTLVRYYETNLCPGWFARLRSDLFKLAKAAILWRLRWGWPPD